jgi:hypothetical protein
MRAKLAIPFSIDRSGHDNAPIGGIAHLPDIVGRIRSVADERQPEVGPYLLETLTHQERIILRLHPAHIKKIALPIKP